MKINDKSKQTVFRAFSKGNNRYIYFYDEYNSYSDFLTKEGLEKEIEENYGLDWKELQKELEIHEIRITEQRIG